MYSLLYSSDCVCILKMLSLQESGYQLQGLLLFLISSHQQNYNRSEFLIKALGSS